MPTRIPTLTPTRRALLARTAALACAVGLVTPMAIAGCGGGARLVTRDETGGLFALEGDEGAAREDAERQIRAHCGARGYRVTADAEFTVAMRDEQEVTQSEASRRIGDDQTRRSSEFSGGTAGSGIGDTVGTSGTLGESPEIYDPATTGATPRLPTPVREHRLEYECGRR